MAAETLGAIALLDPAIKLGRKVWKTYKLQASFGEDFKDYSNHFFSEGVLLDELLRTPIFLLNDHDTRVEFTTALQEVGSPEDLRQLLHARPDDFQKARTILSTLAKLSSLFEECSALIESYLPRLDTPQGLSLDESRTGGLQALGSQRNSVDISLNLHDNGTHTPDPQPLNTPVELNQQGPKSQKSLFRRLLHRPKKSTSHFSSSTGEASVGPERLRDQDVQAQNFVENSQSHAMQSTVSVGRRVRHWVLSDRERFKMLTQKIQESNMTLERLVAISDIRQRTQPIEISASTSHVSQENDAGPCLAVLAKVLVESTRPAQTNYMLELKDNYKKYAEESRSSSAYLQLAPKTFLFPIKVYLPGTLTDSNIQITASLPRSSEVLFAITPGCKGVVTTQDARTKWEFICDIAHELYTSAQYYKDQIVLCLDQHAITIFQHYPASASIMAKIADMLSDDQLRKDKELIGFRYHLAYNIAAFFLNAASAQTPISSQELFVFFETQPSSMDPEDRIKQLTTPYLKYGMRVNATKSLHGPRPAHQGIPVHKLGILLHEIGSWTPIVTPGQPRVTMDKAIDIAKANAAKSRNALGLNYFNALQECLNWPENFPDNEFQKKVLTPLLELKSKYVLPTDEIY